VPRNNFLVANRRVDEPILVTDIHPVSRANAGITSSQAGSLPSDIRERGPWRTMGVGVASLATPVGIGVLHPVLGEIIAVIEVAMILTIFGTALFGSIALSDRAFRLLRWLGNRPEPPGWTSADTAVVSQPIVLSAASQSACGKPIRRARAGRGRQGSGET
jgi:hypothetical protein